MALLQLMLQSEAEDFVREYFHRNSQAEEDRQKECQAATRVQSWFRGCQERAHLSHLRKKAIIIQKIWRGFTARARVRQMVKEAYFKMVMNFYEEMAVRIQRRWRGFFVRKSIFDFYARKQVRRELDELVELQKRERDCLAMVKEQTAKVYQAHRLHHLISTTQCPGVFNSPFRPAPHETELLLRQVKYQAPTRLAPARLPPRGRAHLLGIHGATAPGFSGTPGSPRITTTGSFASKPILPSIPSKKHQAPFRQPGEVWEQPMHCSDLMSRLQTSFTHLEEAQSQIRQHKLTGSLSRSSNTFAQPADATKTSFRS